MNNLVMEKVWEDGNLFELRIEGDSEYVTAYQNCYVQDIKIKEAGNLIGEFISSSEESCYIEFGSKTGNYTPAFSMKLVKPDISGKMKIEVDIEIADNDSRCHRCVFYIDSELGAMERFAKGLYSLASGTVSKIEMFEM